MKNIKLDYDTLPNGKSELCDQCCSIIDSEQSYYFNSNSNDDLYFDHPSCVELYYLKKAINGSHANLSYDSIGGYLK